MGVLETYDKRSGRNFWVRSSAFSIRQSSMAGVLPEERISGTFQADAAKYLVDNGADASFFLS